MHYDMSVTDGPTDRQTDRQNALAYNVHKIKHMQKKCRAVGVYDRLSSRVVSRPVGNTQHRRASRACSCLAEQVLENDNHNSSGRLAVVIFYQSYQAAPRDVYRLWRQAVAQCNQYGENMASFNQGPFWH